MTYEEKKYLYESIIEEVAKIVKKKLNELQDDMKLSLEGIPEEEIERASHIEWYLMAKAPFGSLLSEDYTINEELKRIYSVNDVFKYIKQKYNLYDWQIKIQDKRHDIKFIAILPNNQEVVDMMRKDMDKLGYYLGTEMDVTNGFQKFRGYIFEPFNQKDESESIRRYGCLYHVTPVVNLESILKRGLLPHSSNVTEEFAYPERIYLVEGRHDPETLYKLAEVLYKNKRRRNNKTEPKYAIIMLDMMSIPEDIKMYYDGNYEYGIFVEDNIPADTIVDIDIYDCEKHQYVKYGFWEKLKSKIISLFKK